MLTCREMVELVGDYVERRLSTWDRVKFQLHLGMCNKCREYVHQLEVTRKTVGQMPEQQMPAEVREEMLARFRDWKGGEDVAPPDLGDLEVLDGDGGNKA